MKSFLFDHAIHAAAVLTEAIAIGLALMTIGAAGLWIWQTAADAYALFYPALS